MRLCVRLLLGLCVLATLGCASYPHSRSLGLQRAIFPGLGDLDETGIETALSQRVELSPPLSGGLVWLSEGDPSPPGVASPITEYTRTGVLEAALDALRQEPFRTVAALPTIARVSDAAPGRHTIDALRSASARFQYELALLLQTGAAEDLGFNPIALGYAGLVTIPLLPGNDLAVASSAELCAVDVRTGLLLGCARGRAQAMDRVLFVWQLDRARERLTERTLREAVAAAARDLRGQVAARISAHDPIAQEGAQEAPTARETIR